jgi:hypothetical protein
MDDSLPHNATCSRHEPPNTLRNIVGRALLIGLLGVHATLLGMSIPRNAVTFDEVSHLPAGMCNWQRGQFWLYHTNPPFVRLVFSLPALLLAEAPDNW